MALKSNLDLVDECDNFPYAQASTSSNSTSCSSNPSTHWTLRHRSHHIGTIPSWVITRIGLRRFDPSLIHLDPETRAVEVLGEDFSARTENIGRFLEGLRDEGVFEVLKGWRGEGYPIYCYGGKGEGEGKGRELVMSMERSATPLFGVVTWGVHLTGYVEGSPGPGGSGMRIWVPTRSHSKQTYPGMLDNTVAGGVTTGEGPLEGLIREAREEASLREEFVKERARPVGTVTYSHVRDERAGGETGLFQPECQYVYDLELPAEVVLKPNDEEVERFDLLTVEDVQTALAEGKFKPNCSLVVLDFFIRHGILTPENEPDYVEIVSRIHRRLESLTP